MEKLNNNGKISVDISLMKPWPVGGLPTLSTNQLVNLCINKFSLPFLPEFSKLEADRMDIFWPKAFKLWKENNEETLLTLIKSRPGIDFFLKNIAPEILLEKQLKFQVIGPNALIHLLNSKNINHSKEDIFNFINYYINEIKKILTHYKKEYFISLDDPLPKMSKSNLNNLFLFFENNKNKNICYHSCGDFLEEVFTLPIKVIHCDGLEFNDKILMSDHKYIEATINFFDRGGIVSFGFVPSNSFILDLKGIRKGFDDLLSSLPKSVLSSVNVSTTCGLSFISKEDIEIRLGVLEDLNKHIQQLII